MKLQSILSIYCILLICMVDYLETYVALICNIHSRDKYILSMYDYFNHLKIYLFTSKYPQFLVWPLLKWYIFNKSMTQVCTYKMILMTDEQIQTIQNSLTKVHINCTGLIFVQYLFSSIFPLPTSIPFYIKMSLFCLLKITVNVSR